MATKRPQDMSRGWRQRTVQQQGEYLVAAELAKRGYMATTFTGNVPHFDIVAVDSSGRTVKVQVKTKSEKGNWQFDLGHFASVKTAADGTQSLRKKRMAADDIAWVLVHLHEDRAADFYWFAQAEFQTMLLRRHRRYVKRHGGKRVRKPESRHTSLSSRDIPAHLGAWDVVDQAFSAAV